MSPVDREVSTLAIMLAVLLSDNTHALALWANAGSGDAQPRSDAARIPTRGSPQRRQIQLRERHAAVAL
jgi:hypothetical protein